MNAKSTVSSCATPPPGQSPRPRPDLSLPPEPTAGARPPGADAVPDVGAGVWVNDVHSELNPTRVERVVRPRSVGEVQAAVSAAAAAGLPVSVCGARHSMGGQPFVSGGMLLDMTNLSRPLRLDRAGKTVEVEAGIAWPAVVAFLEREQVGEPRPLGIIQKQTGADDLTLGGALAANIHGRGLRMAPFVADVESFDLVDVQGRLRHCSRREDAELFRLAAGGYGVFGVVVRLRLRLAERTKLRRRVTVEYTDDFMRLVAGRIEEGYCYGDFQYMTDAASDGFLRQGVFSCYRPVDDPEPVPPGQREMSVEQWRELYHLAHDDKRQAWETYSSYYRSTDGQLYWSDAHQFGVYLSGYHHTYEQIARRPEKGSLMISELYVPRDRLVDFLETVRRDARRREMDIIYGTVRLIERDEETFLAWAKEPYACVIFNLRLVHTPEGLAKGREDFRLLIDRAIAQGGSFYLTYHRWAARDQLLHCYPQFPEFIEHKNRYDPGGRFQSDWWRHSCELLG